ncbi:protein tyrosine phosphatase [Cavenderia fasciculata]|uniref:Protein tyrosine phosphatase n=1 Tax=Cavenderia fasciculata TaxID=261658 RepID=F4PJD5_CACFS|nr:protein tyrosine phosphatase [Cavenderia fasciculata]EGG24421.1 protein tyrosine phosphatase [Cavenderia fasciculata]|eukprot:XP_004362272.1 protein tyrosine phosphatase [Cavenderia fasciculata]
MFDNTVSSHKTSIALLKFQKQQQGKRLSLLYNSTITTTTSSSSSRKQVEEEEEEEEEEQEQGQGQDKFQQEQKEEGRDFSIPSSPRTVTTPTTTTSPVPPNITTTVSVTSIVSPRSYNCSNSTCNNNQQLCLSSSSSSSTLSKQQHQQDRINRMSNLLRVAVSKQKRRYQKNGYDLDLAYITDRVIAMGFPSEKVEGVFRNPMKEVQKFLDQYHKDHYRVYNLCSERDYDHNKFYGRVGCYPFDDHNAPAFELIQKFCQDVDEWFKEDPKNIAVVHCKAGKGLMICCWLLYCGMWKNTEESLRFYAALRTYNQKGVTIPSQIRYVHYFGRSMRESIPATKSLLLKKIYLKPLPLDISLQDITFNVSVGKTLVYHSKQVENVTIHRLQKKKIKKSQSKRDLKEKDNTGDKGSSANDATSSTNGSNGVLGSSVRGQSLIDKHHQSLSKGSSQNYKSQIEHTSSNASLSSSSSFDYQAYYLKQQNNAKEEEQEEYISFDVGGIMLAGDIRIEFCNKNERMFMYWFNSTFTSHFESISKTGLDKAHKDKNHKSYPENFRVEMVFDELPVEHNDQNGSVQHQQQQNISTTPLSVAPAIAPPSDPSPSIPITPVKSDNQNGATTVIVNQKDETDSEDSSDSTSSDEHQQQQQEPQQPTNLSSSINVANN